MTTPSDIIVADVLNYCDRRMEDMLARPEMFAVTTEALELQFLTVLEIRDRIKNPEHNGDDIVRIYFKFSRKYAGLDNGNTFPSAVTKDLYVIVRCMKEFIPYLDHLRSTKQETT